MKIEASQVNCEESLKIRSMEATKHAIESKLLEIIGKKHTVMKTTRQYTEVHSLMSSPIVIN